MSRHPALIAAVPESRPAPRTPPPAIARERTQLGSAMAVPRRAAPANTDGPAPEPPMTTLASRQPSYARLPARHRQRCPTMSDPSPRQSVLDELDAELICRLDQDARTTVSELAVQIGVARNTVQARLRRLVDGGILTRFQPVIDLERVGVSAMALMWVYASPSQRDAVAMMLARLPQVLESVVTSERSALMTRVAVSSDAELAALVERVGNLPSVDSVAVERISAVPVPYRTSPLVRLLTRRSGWGRSTPLPT